MIKLRLAILSFFCICVNVLKAQDNYRTIASGNWGSTSIWEKDINGNGIFTPTALSPSSSVATITIRNGHTVTINASISVDQTVLESGATVNIRNGANLTVLNGAGDDFTVNGNLNDSGSLIISNSPSLALVNINGTLNNSGTITNASSTSLIFGANSVYNHQYTTTPGIIPIANWHISSTCKITGYTTNTTPPIGLNQAFGNFEWNTPNLNISNYFYLDGEPSVVSGDFRIKDAGSLSANSGIMFNSLNLTKTFNIGDTFEITNDAYVSLNESGTGTCIVNTKHFLLSGGNTYLDLADMGVGKLNISGNYIVTNGNLQISSNNSSAGVYFKPQVPYSMQLFTSSFIPSTPIKYTVDSSANVSIPNGSFIAGSGSLNVLSGGMVTLGSLEPLGAIQNGINGGNIRLSTRSFSPGSMLIYNGTSQQYLGGGFPLNAKLVIRNNNGVFLQSNALIISTLSLDSGSLNLNGFNLTIGNNQTVLGQVEVNKGYIKGSGIVTRWFDTSNVTLGNNTGLFPFASHTDTTRYLWISGKPSSGGTISASYNNNYGTTIINPAYNDNGPMINIRNNFNWTISTGSGITGNFGIKLRASKSGGVNNVSDLRVSLINGIAPGSAVNGSGTFDQPEVSRIGIPSANFNNTYFLATNSTQNPLPVKILKFKAALSQKKISLTWAVAQEKNIESYKVMLSTDLKNWEFIDLVTDVKNNAGNTNYSKEIITNHTRLFLQIIAVDINGMYTYSELINIGDENPTTNISIFPNPIKKGETINLVCELGIKKITLLSLQGSEIYTKEIIDEPINYQLNIDDYPSGAYLLKIITSNDTIIKRIEIK